jgi:hypothetical protein
VANLHALCVTMSRIISVTPYLQIGALNGVFVETLIQYVLR